jgi:hypothetical protein
MAEEVQLDTKTVYRLVELYDKIGRIIEAKEEAYNVSVAHYVQQRGIILKQLDAHLTGMSNSRLKPEVKVDGVGVVRLKLSNKVTVKNRTKLLDELTGLFSQQGNEAFDYVTLTPKPKECVLETIDKRTGLVLVEPKIAGLEVKRTKKVSITKK